MTKLSAIAGQLLPAAIAIAALSALAIAALALGNPLLKHSLVEMLIMVVVVVGLYIFVGNSGILSFGHISFMCLGAYATAWLTLPLPLKKLNMPGLPALLHQHSIPAGLSVPVSALGAAIFAAIIGVPLLRLAGVAASIATLAVLMIVTITFSNWESVTLGTSSIVGLPAYSTIGTMLAWATAAVLVARLYEISRHGLMLRAARDNEIAAKAIGVDVFRERLIAWVISAFVVAAGGVLYAHFVGTISVDAFSLNMTFVTLAMLVVGGSGSLIGAVAGVAAISLLIELLRQLERGVAVGPLAVSLPPGSQELGIAAAMLGMLLIRPRGLVSGFAARRPLARRETNGGTVAAGKI